MTAGAVVRLAWRQARGGGRHLAVLGACVALGVGALVAVGTLGAGLEATLAREAKALLGGDVELRSARALPAEAETALGHLPTGARVVRVRELVGMARGTRRGDSLLVELKAVGDGYPLYGQLKVVPDARLASLLADDGAVVQRPVLDRLGVAVGDRLTVGAISLTIRGVVETEPDRSAGLVSLGPRVFLSLDALQRSGLVGFGSRVRYRVLLGLPAGSPAREVRAELARDIASPSVRVAAYDEAQPGLRRFFSQLTMYLGLVGLASLLVGGIGVAAAMAAFVSRQTPTLAVLKALGADTRTLVVTYLLQTQVVALVASLAGIALGLAVQPLLATAIAGLVPFTLEPRAEAGTLVRAMAMGLGTTLLCAWAPLAAIRTVPPWLVLRQDVAPPGRGRRRIVPAVVLGLSALVLWQAGSLKIGAIFVGVSLVALLVLWSLARLIIAGARRLPRARGLAWRHGVAALARPGSHAPRVVVALGIAMMLLVTVALLQGVLGRQIDHERRRDTPSFFFLDIQPDQREPFTRLVGEAAAAPPVLTPVVRGRLAAVDGERLTRAVVERRQPRGDAEEGRWYFTREYVLTWSDAPPEHNRVIQGRWWTPGAHTTPEASVEETAARHLGVGPGSRLTFDIQGVEIEAVVTSLRRVDWQSLSTNFFVILSPGALDGAPVTWVATARVPTAAETALQNAVIAAFPNVTAIPLRDVLERVASVLADIAVAVRLVALFTLGAGLVVMTAALTATRSQRLYESVVLRTLGATRGLVARAFAVEYGVLGAAAGLGGGTLALVLAWALGRWVLEAPWSFDPTPLVLGLAATVTLALGVGFLSTFRVLGEKPLPVLRRE